MLLKPTRLARAKLRKPGETVGPWTVIGPGDPAIIYTESGSKYNWLCECKCGSRRNLTSNHLSNAARYKYGCRNCSNRAQNGLQELLGTTVGSWRVLEYLGTKGEKNNRKSLWLCECTECGTPAKLIRSAITGTSGSQPKKCQCNTKCIKYTTLIGTEIGNFLVVDITADNGYVAIVFCDLCNSTQYVYCNLLAYCLKRKIPDKLPACKGCDALMKSDPEFKFRRYLTCAVQADERGLECTVTPDYLRSIFTGKCSLTGESIELNASGGSTRRTASLDRIDSSKGYIEGNLQWVHKDVQFSKGKLSNTEYIMWCNLIAGHLKVK